MINKICIMVLLALTLNAKHIHHESHYRDLFCNKLGGVTEYYLKDKTRVDCMDFKRGYAWELDFDGHKIYESVGQALHYNLVSGLRPAIAIIVKDRNSKSLQRLKNLCKEYDIKIEVIEE